MSLNNLTNFFHIAVISQCLFSVLYLSSYKWQRNKWMVLLFLSIFLLQLGFLINTSTSAAWHKIFIGNPGFIMLVFPAIYFYSKTLVNETSKKTAPIYLHFLPFLIFYFFFLFMKVDSPSMHTANFSAGKTRPIDFCILIAIITVVFYYGYLILKLIRINQVKYKEEYADTNLYLTLNWLKYLCWFNFSFILFAVMGLVLANQFPSLVLPAWVIEFIFWFSCMTVSFFTFRQPTLYQRPIITSANKKVNTAADNLNTKSLLSKIEIEEFSQKLEDLLLEKKPFLQAGIKMPDIATELDVSPNILSKFLNEHYKVNFFTFINRHRVNYAVELLKKEKFQHYTLEAISQLAGFKSKTTFNTRFKEMMGESPSVFRRKLMK